jgi:hypothetical protein
MLPPEAAGADCSQETTADSIFVVLAAYKQTVAG